MESYCGAIPAEPRPIPEFVDDEDESFIVLGSCSLSDDSFEALSAVKESFPPLQTDHLRDMESALAVNITQMDAPLVPAVPSFVNTAKFERLSLQDFSFEETEKNVQEIIEDNQKLRGLIVQYNMTTKTQHEKLLIWRDEVYKIMANYKSKFSQAKGVVDKLKEENAKLRMDVERFGGIKELQDVELMHLKSLLKDKPSGEVKESNSELEVALNKIEALEAKLEETKVHSRQTDTELEVAWIKIDALEAQIDAGRLEKQESNSDLEVAWGKIQTLERYVEDIGVENQKLELRKQQLTELTDSLSARLQENETYAAQLHVAKNADMKNFTVELKKMKEQIDMRLELNKSQYIEFIDKVKMENVDLREKLKEHNQCKNNTITKDLRIEKLEADIYQQKSMGNKIETALRQQIKELTEQIANMQSELDPNLCENYKRVNHQLVNSQKTITALEEALRVKSDQMEESHHLLQQVDPNETFALKEQLQIYKSDFEAERASKEALKGEKDQIHEDLRNLQRRNGQLQEEIELMRERGFVMCPPAEVPRAPQAGTERNEKYVCPKCSFSFKDYQSLENHVHRCLDMDEALP